MARFIALSIGLLLILFFYFIVGWFLTNQQNAFLWPWWVKLIYLIVVFASWGNLADSFQKDDR